MSLIQELKWRGLVHQISSSKLLEVIQNESLVIFAGFDPTADSLHIGHLLPLIALKHAHIHGHKPIALIGGATGMIGDPSGKSNERVLLDASVVNTNVASIANQIKKLIPEVSIVNNIEWFEKMNVLDFLRFGKSFSINSMLARDAIKSRLANGISFTEFSYVLFQAFDFLQLNKQLNCTLQIGGSDQFGNIVSGIDLIRRDGRESFGLTLPIVTNSDGEKFGKSTKGAIWLDETKTSIHELSQFFINVTDSEVIKLLKMFTFLPVDDIEQIEIQTTINPGKRLAQKTLANEVCKFVHGCLGLEIPSITINNETTIVDALIISGFCSSRSDAHRNIKQQAIKIDGKTINNDGAVVFGNTNNVLLSKGKRNKMRLIRKINEV